MVVALIVLYLVFLPSSWLLNGGISYLVVEGQPIVGVMNRRNSLFF